MTFALRFSLSHLTTRLECAARVLTTFYCEKIQDSGTVIPALDGLLTLASLSTFGVNEATDTANSYVNFALFLIANIYHNRFLRLIEHISMKSLVQSVRYVVFKIVDTLLAKHLTGELCKMIII